MSGGSSPAAPRAAATSPWLIAVVVALATFMEVLDTTIANVALPHIAGGMGVSADEASWVVTTYLVANAASLTASSDLARRLGRKRFFLICLALFTASSILCGFAWNLQSLLLFRVAQGLGGGGMVPVSQSILADAFPPSKRSQGFALFGVAVVVAPVIGPTIGGWIADNWSWRWCFLINGPVGIATLALISVILRESGDELLARQRLKQQTNRFDYVGFALIATFLGALEVVLDRGLEDDWFASRFIVGVTAISAAAFVLMIPWELRHRSPVLDLRILFTRQFGTCFIVMAATGAILLATTQFLPLLVQQDFGYTAEWAGLVLSPGGFVTAFMMPIAGRLIQKVQPRTLIATGAAVCALAMHDMTRLNGSVGFWFFALARVVLGFGLPLVFIPILTASYEGLPRGKTDVASALINVARNTGASIGISIGVNTLAHRAQFHQSRLVELANPSTLQFQQALRGAQEHFAAQGSPLSQVRQQAFAWVGQQVQLQASFLAYIDVFHTLMLVSLAAIPLALILRKTKLGEAAPAAH